MALLPNLSAIRIFWYAPAPIFAAQVNMPSGIAYPIQDIIFDNVTTGAYTDLAADMFFTLGSAAGLDDYGRGRLRAAPTANTLKVGRASQGFEDGELNVVDNAYLTVYPDYRVHSKTPAIVNYVEYKDGDLAVGDLTQTPPPVANMGPDRAGRIDADTGTLTLYFDASTSFAVADGATITGYAWDSQGGTFVLGTSATDSGVYIEFDPGVRYVSLTVTDSNGKTHTTRRLVLADDPDDSLCVSGMQLQNLTWTKAGMVARVRVLQDLPRADYPDGGHLLLFEGRTPEPTDWSNVLFSGWHQSDQASSAAQEFYLRRETELTCVDVAGRLDALPGFDQRLEVPLEADVADGWSWGYMATPNLDKFLHYLVHWHSTAASVADFFTSGTWDAYPFVLFDAVGDTLYNQLARQANRLVPDHEFTCDRFGRLHTRVNPQYQDAGDRTATIQNSVTEQGWSAIEFGYTRPPKVYLLRGSAVLTQAAWLINDDGDKDLEPPVFCIAPGTAQGQGAREQTLGERLAQSQATLNAVTGHHYARLNARYGEITLTLNSNADPWDFDPAALTWVELHTPAEVMPQRGIDFTTIRCLCTEVSIDYQYGEEATTYRARVRLEPETVGLPALTEEQEPALPVGEQPPVTTPPDFGLTPGQESVAAIDEGGKLYRTSDFQTDSGSGGPTWEEVDLGITDTKLYSFVVDPFSPGYINGSGAINAWVVSESDIYRVEDLFGTSPSATSVHTFATAISPSNRLQTRTVQASFGRFFDADNPWLLVVSHYGDASGHTGTWALRSLDAGQTWESEVQISAHYDSAAIGTEYGAEPGEEVAVYTSPKTPGYALTTAYISTSSAPVAAGFVSTDWGETWTQLLVEDADPTHKLPRWAQLNDGSGLIEWQYLGTVFDQTKLAFANDTSSFTDTLDKSILLAMPSNVLNAYLTCRYEIVVDLDSDAWTSFSSTIGFHVPVAVAEVTDYVAPSVPGTGGAAELDFYRDLTITGADWDKSREDFEASPPTTNSGYVYMDFRVIASKLLSHYVYNWVRVRMELTAIEWDDASTTLPGEANHLLEPGQRLAAAIHVPWADNDAELVVLSSSFGFGPTYRYRINRAAGDNATFEDISPSGFGPVRSGFGLRAYDSDRSNLVMGAAHNDTSYDPTDTTHSVFVSTDGGDTWTAILGPTADSAFTGKKGYSAAFAGDDPEAIYIWGAPAGVDGCISFTADGGDNVDDRRGNLSSFAITSFLGIAGGPTGA